MLESSFEQFQDKIIKNKPKNYLLKKSGDVDVWFEPKVVWEIKAADIQVSPVYKCAYKILGLDSNKGLGLRFPRFIRERKDKTVENSTTPLFMYELFSSQAVVKIEDDEDYY